MDARTWLGLEPTHNPMRWVLPVTPAISTPGPFLFGGCALGAAIAALEATSGRPVVWATAQYLSYAHPPSVLDIDVTLAATGRSITQGRVVGHVADTEILTVNAALGSRDFDLEGVWVERPEVRPPDECPVRGLARPRDPVDPGPHRHPPGRRTRLGRDRGPPRARRPLAAVGPHARPARPASRGPASPSSATTCPSASARRWVAWAAGNSLDNTLRVYRLVPTEWVLLDIRIHAVANGFGHGVVHLWAEDGTLLATASQSTIVRMMPPEMLAAMKARAGDMAPTQDPPAPV